MIKIPIQSIIQTSARIILFGGLSFFSNKSSFAMEHESQIAQQIASARSWWFPSLPSFSLWPTTQPFAEDESASVKNSSLTSSPGFQFISYITGSNNLKGLKNNPNATANDPESGSSFMVSNPENAMNFITLFQDPNIISTLTIYNDPYNKSPIDPWKPFYVHIKYLTHLKFGFNPVNLTKIDTSLLGFLNDNPNIGNFRNLSFENTVIVDDENTISAMITFIKKSPNMEYLNLSSHNSLPLFPIDKLSPFPNLKILDISSFNSDILLTSLATFLKHTPQLTSIKVGPGDYASLLTLTRSLNDNCQNLTEFCGNFGKNCGIAAITELLNGSHGLKKLHFTGYTKDIKIEKEPFDYFIEAVGNSNLKEIKLDFFDTTNHYGFDYNYRVTQFFNKMSEVNQFKTIDAGTLALINGKVNSEYIALYSLFGQGNNSANPCTLSLGSTHMSSEGAKLFASSFADRTTPVYLNWNISADIFALFIPYIANNTITITQYS